MHIKCIWRVIYFFLGGGTFYSPQKWHKVLLLQPVHTKWRRMRLLTSMYSSGCFNRPLVLVCPLCVSLGGGDPEFWESPFWKTFWAWPSGRKPEIGPGLTGWRCLVWRSPRNRTMTRMAGCSLLKETSCVFFFSQQLPGELIKVKIHRGWRFTSCNT